METLSRRRLLEAGIAGAAVSLAGCTSSGGDAEMRSVTVAASVDEEASVEIRQEAQADQQEIQQQLESGEIDEAEAQQQLQEARLEARAAERELLTEAVEAIETHVEDTDSLTLVDSAPDTGIMLVEGEAGAVVDLLDRSDVSGLLEESQFEDLQQSGP